MNTNNVELKVGDYPPFDSHKPFVSKRRKWLWYVNDTKLPDILCNEINTYFERNIQPKPGQESSGRQGYRIVDARWAQTGDWIAPFIWNYVDRINNENFEYDITTLAFNEVHHLTYKPGYQYGWHSDDYVCNATRPGPIDWGVLDFEHKEYVRKLSFTLQLSHPSEYTGGDLQILDVPNETFFCPKDRGSLMVFDSRCVHRVMPVKTGVRKCLVGWALGPKWR